MIPIRDDNPTRRRALVTLALIVANVFVFVFLQPRGEGRAVITLGAPDVIAGDGVSETEFVFWQAAIPCELTTMQPLDELEINAALADNSVCRRSDASPVFPRKQPLFSALVSMFLHGGWAHLFGNLWFLWIFGNNVEDRWGRLRYLAFYIAGGFAALAVHVLASPRSTEPVVGASGAIAAVMGAYLMIYPRKRILVLLAIVPIKVRAWIMLGVWFVMQFFTNPDSGVAWLAHVGGFVFGIVTAIAWRRHRFDVEPLRRSPTRP